MRLLVLWCVMLWVREARKESETGNTVHCRLAAGRSSDGFAFWIPSLLVFSNKKPNKKTWKYNIFYHLIASSTPKWSLLPRWSKEWHMMGETEPQGTTQSRGLKIFKMASFPSSKLYLFLGFWKTITLDKAAIIKSAKSFADLCKKISFSELKSK